MTLKLKKSVNDCKAALERQLTPAVERQRLVKAVFILQQRP